MGSSSSSSPPENLSAERKKAIQELIQGRELANQLRIVLGNPFVGTDHDGGSVEAAGDLVAKILGSFTETISILNNRSRRLSDEHELQVLPADTRVSSPCWDGPKSEDSEESSKTSALKDRRGCYKRRKTSQTWTRTTPNLIDDGHAWRKYGQKVILNAKHPRNYFRCTHKFDQGCQATKQVQRTEEDPPMYRTTYLGNHTCKNLLKTPHIILDSTPTGDQYHDDSSSVLLSFAFGTPNPNPNPNNNIVKIKQPQEPFFPTPAAPLIKQEHSNYKAEQQQPSSLEHNNNSQSSSSDHYLLSPDMTMTTFESPDHGDRMSSGMYSSCTASPHGRHSLDMDLILGLGSVDFDDVFSFEF